MQWRIILFVLSFGVNYTSFAQILNVEKSRTTQDSLSHFETNISLSTTLYNRSTDADQPAKFLSVGGNANFAYYSQKHSYIALNHLSYMELNDHTFINTIYSHFRVNLMRRKKISYEVFAQYQNDLRRGLDKRILGGAGLRFVLVHTEKTSLALGLGAMYEEENWQHPKSDMPNESTQILKSTNYMAFHTDLSETAKFGLISYFQAGSGRNRLNVDSNLSFKITKNISFRTTFSAAYDAKPVVPVTKFIYKLTNGISLTF
jgi:hypothetical protein